MRMRVNGTASLLPPYRQRNMETAWQTSQYRPVDVGGAVGCTHDDDVAACLGQ